MDTTDSLNAGPKSSTDGATNLASKIRNIDGKIRMPIRGATFTKLLNDTINTSNDKSLNDSQSQPKSVVNKEQPVPNSSFASVLNGEKQNPKINFRLMFSKEQVKDSDFVLPVENVMLAEDRFANSLVSFFVGLEQVLEKGPWMIRNQPLILTKWTPNLELSKDKIGKPIMLDAFTSAMCEEPWGRIGFARALIEISADKDLKKEVTMVVLIIDAEGY
ncbi:hypothetical protein Tco_1260028, partial [Tanacetum coccineum]